MASQILTAYRLEDFVKHAASAMAAARVLMYTLGFAFLVFAPDLYDRLGYGWGNSMLAFLWVVLCFPLPVVFWLCGDKLRAMGRGSKEGQGRWCLSCRGWVITLGGLTLVYSFPTKSDKLRNCNRLTMSV